MRPTLLNVCFWPKADIAQRQLDHFQPAGLTRYDVLFLSVGG